MEIIIRQNSVNVKNVNLGKNFSEMIMDLMVDRVGRVKVYKQSKPTKISFYTDLNHFRVRQGTGKGEIHAEGAVGGGFAFPYILPQLLRNRQDHELRPARRQDLAVPVQHIAARTARPQQLVDVRLRPLEQLAP